VSFLQNLFSRFYYWLDFMVLAAVLGAAAFLWSKRSWRLLAILAVIALSVVCLFWLPRRYPSRTFLDPRLPQLFIEYFWTWVLVLSLAAIFSVVYLARLLIALRPAAPAEAAPSDLEGRFPEIDSAWEEILIRLGQAQINLSDQHVYLIIAPDENKAASLINSAGLPLFAQGPDVPSPIHVYATSEGVLLSCAGASALGTADAEGSARMEYLCRRLLSQQPDCPIVRGVALVFPIDWAAQPDAVKTATAARDDLRAIERVLQVRCPVFAVISQMETVPGFTEFIERMPAAMRQNRCGFAIPSTQVFSGDLIQRGMIWMSGWFHSWILNQVAEDLLGQAGNNWLISLDHEFRNLRKRLRNILEATFSTLRGTEPVLFRGCYFVACGASPNEQAFAAGLVRGVRGRIISEHRLTEWTTEAEVEDRHFKRVALAVGIVGVLLALVAWYYIATLTPLGWVGVIALSVTWIIALVRLGRY